MLLSIITINYKKSHLTLACINSLYEKFDEDFKNNNFELIVVDNASGNESLSFLKKAIKEKEYKNITIIENQKNVGFSTGCNNGAKKAKGDQLLFLNNDTVIRDKGIKDMLIYMIQNKQAGIVGGQLSNSDGSPQPSVGKFYNLFNAFLFLLGLQKYGLIGRNPGKIVEVDWVKGGLLMIRKDNFEKLNGFDEKIFMYMEDMELCYRAKLNNIKVFFYPDVAVAHAEQGSSSRTYAIINIYQNLLYFYRKHKSYTEYLFLKIFLKTKAMLLIGIGRITGNTYLIQTYEKAFKVA